MNYLEIFSQSQTLLSKKKKKPVFNFFKVTVTPVLFKFVSKIGLGVLYVRLGIQPIPRNMPLTWFYIKNTVFANSGCWSKLLTMF